jgi:hypothetical protein
MFERYTEKARRAIFFARYEASQYGSPYIESEHLLLGIMREDRVPVTQIEAIRKEIESHITIRERISSSGEVPFSQECKRILIHALEEAERLGHKHVGTEHLLLGIQCEDQCLAARMVQAHELTVSRPREQATSSGRRSEPVNDSAFMSNSDLQPAAVFVFERQPYVSDCADTMPNQRQSRSGRWAALVGRQAPSRVTRPEELVLSRLEVPALTITADPNSHIQVTGGNRDDWFIRFCGRGDGDNEADARDRLAQRSITRTGSTVSVNGPAPSDHPQARASLIVDAPADAPVVVHGSYASIDIFDMVAAVRITATHGRGKILDTKGQVDADAFVLDFAGSTGRLNLSAVAEINLKMTNVRFEGRLFAWSQGPIRMLVPPGFMTAFEALVTRPENFACRTEFRSQIKQDRKYSLYRFTYAGDGGATELMHLYSEHRTIVIDTIGQKQAIF